jgi:TRAP-type C4-dicarboxylate transport system permease small subunit
MMKTISKWVSRMTDAIAATLLAAIFLVFLLQIASRYLPKIVTYLDLGWIPAFAAIQPLGWTLELIGILWVWVIFFSCAFVVREQDHVKFDIIYLIVSNRTRRIFALITSLAIVVGMIYAFLPTWDYVDFMRMRRTSTVRNPFTGAKIPLRTIFFIYMVFMAAVGARYAWLFVKVWRHGPPKTELELAVEATREDKP